MRGKVALYIPGLMESPEFVTEVPEEGDPTPKVYNSKEEAANELRYSLLPNELEARHYVFVPEEGEPENLFDR